MDLGRKETRPYTHRFDELVAGLLRFADSLCARSVIPSAMLTDMRFAILDGTMTGREVMNNTLHRIAY